MLKRLILGHIHGFIENLTVVGVNVPQSQTKFQTLNTPQVHRVGAKNMVRWSAVCTDRCMPISHDPINSSCSNAGHLAMIRMKHRYIPRGQSNTLHLHLGSMPLDLPHWPRKAGKTLLKTPFWLKSHTNVSEWTQSPASL